MLELILGMIWVLSKHLAHKHIVSFTHSSICTCTLLLFKHLLRHKPFLLMENMSRLPENVHLQTGWYAWWLPAWVLSISCTAQNWNKCLFNKYFVWVSDPSGTQVREPSWWVSLMSVVKAVQSPKDLTSSSILLVHGVAVLASLIFYQRGLFKCTWHSPGLPAY